MERADAPDGAGSAMKRLPGRRGLALKRADLATVVWGFGVQALVAPLPNLFPL
jgi:hypothetical protein